MDVEDFFVRPTEGWQTRWWGGLEGGFLHGAMLRITKQQRVGRKTYINKMKETNIIEFIPRAA
jgi:hypothetical protein